MPYIVLLSIAYDCCCVESKAILVELDRGGA